MPGVVVIRKCKNLQDFGVAHQRFEYIHPIFQVASAVDDGLIPRRCLLLNPFAVSKPPNIGEVGGNQIELLFHLPRSWHLTYAQNPAFSEAAG